MDFKHIPVLLDESIQGLRVLPNGLYMDGTLGGGSHSLAILKNLAPSGLLIGVDRDENAIQAAKERLAGFTNVTYVHDNFANVKFFTESLRVGPLDGILLDLGVSSHQFDEALRGFSYRHDAPLDMRMDRRQRFSAFDVVNHYNEDKLSALIKAYGEERWAKRIASFIVAGRKDKPIQTTFELVSIIKKAIPKGARTDGPHPAKRTFQAIRIEVNAELVSLENAIFDLVGCLKPGGTLCVITFHSLEDRLVKNAFRILQNPCQCPPAFPVCVCGKKPIARIITRKPIVPTEAEIAGNNRARSAKLRILEKL